MSLAPTLIGLTIAGAILVWADRDYRSDAPPHRLLMSFRSNMLARRSCRWRWQLHPTGSSVGDALDVIVELDLTKRYRLHGWARTYLGATLAAHHARGRIERALDEQRRDLEARLVDETVTEQLRHAGDTLHAELLEFPIPPLRGVHDTQPGQAS